MLLPQNANKWIFTYAAQSSHDFGKFDLEWGIPVTNNNF